MPWRSPWRCLLAENGSRYRMPRSATWARVAKDLGLVLRHTPRRAVPRRASTRQPPHIATRCRALDHRAATGCETAVGGTAPLIRARRIGDRAWPIAPPHARQAPTKSPRLPVKVVPGVEPVPSACAPPPAGEPARWRRRAPRGLARRVGDTDPVGAAVARRVHRAGSRHEPAYAPPRPRLGDSGPSRSPSRAIPRRGGCRLLALSCTSALVGPRSRTDPANCKGLPSLNPAPRLQQRRERGRVAAAEFLSSVRGWTVMVRAGVERGPRQLDHARIGP